MKDRDALWHQDPVQGRLKVGVMAGEREAPPPPPWKPVKGATLKAALIAAAPGRSGYGRSLCSPPLCSGVSLGHTELERSQDRTPTMGCGRQSWGSLGSAQWGAG